MPMNKLNNLVRSGQRFTYPKGQVIYSLDFVEEFYLVTKGYIKRFSVSQSGKRSIQAIYGPDYLFPLTPVFTKLLEYNVGQESATYFYETITDVEIYGINNDALVRAAQDDPSLYKSILFESARRIKSNIQQLENNSLEDIYKRVAHHITYLAEEFGNVQKSGIETAISIIFPLKTQDIAEQLDADPNLVNKQMKDLKSKKIIDFENDKIDVLNLDLLKDAYL
jgi:CRP-like cAMP-binding protein